MRRLIAVIGLIYVAVLLLVLVGYDTRSEAAACGAPTPTATHGPSTATPIPPTASPEVHPTIALDFLPSAKAPAGLRAIAACETRDQVRATLGLLVDLLEGWDLVPIGKGPPPGMILVVFEDPEDNQRTIALTVLGDDSPRIIDGGAAESIAREFKDQSVSGTSIATDGRLVWVTYERDNRSHLTWGAFGGARRFNVIADYPADINLIVTAWARAAEHACYPECD
jgi:hypothetical protein